MTESRRSSMKKKKVSLAILMLAGVLAYFASQKPSEAGGWCDEVCGNLGPNGEFCCVAPDCSLVCY
jgi:hypothetical protein